MQECYLALPRDFKGLGFRIWVSVQGLVCSMMTFSIFVGVWAVILPKLAVLVVISRTTGAVN